MSAREATSAPVDPSVDGAVAPILQVRGIGKSFGGVRALDGVDLTVQRGTIAGLIGPNGAGKSTLFNVVTGVTAADDGEVRLSGTEISGSSLEEMARAGIGRTFQSPRGFSSMTVLENLMVVPSARGERILGAFARGGLRRRDARERADEVLARLGLEGHRDAPYEELSGGELRLLEIGRHLMRDIDLLLLDEPTAGVTPSMQDRVADVIRDLNASGMTVLIVEHNLRFVFGLASTVAVLVQGAVIFSGTPDEVQRHPEVISAYLGERNQ